MKLNQLLVSSDPRVCAPRHHLAWLGAAAAAACALALPGTAQAQFFKDAALEQMYTSSRFAELEKTAAARVAAKAEDTQAVLALALTAMRGGGPTPAADATRRKTSINHAEACLQKQPEAAVCHYALGTVLGVQAMTEGMLKAAGSVGRVKDALSQAVALDGQWYPARSALTEFYLLAPGMMGGSNSKAKELARTAPQPEQVRALEARLLLDAEKFEPALQALAQVKTNNDRALADDVAGWIYAAGMGLVNNGQADRARAAFERLYRDRPDDANAIWGMARVQAEAGAHAEAVKLFGAVVGLPGSEFMPVDYRLGVSLQALGQKDAARAALNKYVNAAKGSKKSLEDAKQRLEKLAG
jgi:tetratricopeptide (TPR) repeat protein